MINQMNANDHTENQFFHALKELQIAKLLHKSNITKSRGVSAYEVFQFLLLLIFLYTSSSARSCSFSRSSCAIRGGETGKWHWLGCSN